MCEFLDLTTDVRENYRQRALEYIRNNNPCDCNVVFYLVVYGERSVVTTLTDCLTCSASVRGNKLSFLITDRNANKYRLCYADLKFCERLVDYIYDWFTAYLDELRLQKTVTEIQQLHNAIMLDSTLTYSVAFKASTYSGLRELTDDSIVIGVSTENAELVLELLHVTAQSTKTAERLRDMYIGTFETCIHPIELMHVCNEITQVYKLHTRQVYGNILAQVYTHRLRQVHNGTFLLRTPDFCAAIKLTALAETTLGTISKQNSIVTPDGTVYAVQWLVKPIDINCTRLTLTALEAVKLHLELINATVKVEQSVDFCKSVE